MYDDDSTFINTGEVSTPLDWDDESAPSFDDIAGFKEVEEGDAGE